MFEEQTESKIKQRMLNSIPSDLDKREGSFIYDAISPGALEFVQLYMALNEVADTAFADTATGEYLDRKVFERGITRRPATKATTIVVITGQQGASISKGDYVAADTIRFVVLEDRTIDSSGQTTVDVECDIAGSIGNVPAGAINYFPVAIPGLASVSNPEPAIGGFDTETDEELRERYFEKVRTPPTSGNKYHYLSWAKEVIGVGDAKVFPLWDGPGTVKVVIVDSNKQPANQELVDAVIDHIEDNRPIGATVTVVSAIPLNININANVVISSGYELDEVKANIQSNLIDYLKSIAFVDGEYVSYAKIGSLVLNSEGVLDYTDLKVNDDVANISPGSEEVAILGTVNLV